MLPLLLLVSDLLRARLESFGRGGGGETGSGGDTEPDTKCLNLLELVLEVEASVSTGASPDFDDDGGEARSTVPPARS